MSDRLTILHLTHEGHGAGSSVSIALLARAQRRAGHRVLIGCPADSWLERVLAPRGVEFVPVNFQSITVASYLIEKIAVLGQVDVVNDVNACVGSSACSPAHTYTVLVPDTLVRSGRDDLVVQVLPSNGGTPLNLRLRRSLVTSYLAIVDSVSAALRQGQPTH